jgi:hypothetical protein
MMVNEEKVKELGDNDLQHIFLPSQQSFPPFEKLNPL